MNETAFIAESASSRVCVPKERERGGGRGGERRTEKEREQPRERERERATEREREIEREAQSRLFGAKLVDDLKKNHNLRTLFHNAEAASH